MAAADVVFIAIGTPSRHGDGHADHLSYVSAAAKEIASALKYTVIATKSTVPVGTGDDIERIIRKSGPKLNSPSFPISEFLREEGISVPCNDRRLRPGNCRGSFGQCHRRGYDKPPRQERQTMSVSIRQVHPVFVGEVTGVDISQARSAAARSPRSSAAWTSTPC